MRYFMMDGSHKWVEVDQFVYREPPENMTDNQVTLGSDGCISICALHINFDDLHGLHRLLIDTWANWKECKNPRLLGETDYDWGYRVGFCGEAVLGERSDKFYRGYTIGRDKIGCIYEDMVEGRL